MKKIVGSILFLVAVSALTYGGVFLGNRSPIMPIAVTSSLEVGTIVGEPVDFPLELPPGFKISIFARDIPGARVMAMDRRGNMWVSETKEGKVVMLEVKNGKFIAKHDVFTGLNRPHGLVFDPQEPSNLYIAEEDKISLVKLSFVASSVVYPAKIIDLPAGGRHFTRTVGFGPDNRLYVSIGSSCDVCREKDVRRAVIYSLNKDGSDFKSYATGLRNTVFFRWDERDNLWGTDMGRDYLGDTLPPDEINILEDGKNYGWPNCYGKNIHDTKFDPEKAGALGASKNTYIRNPCLSPFETPSYVDLPAHVAPLGIDFSKGGWPTEYAHSIFVAEHGSWNSTSKIGYKIVRIKLDENNTFIGMDDFITGWLTDANKVLGRPVDVLTLEGGVMYVSDDYGGVIYKVIYDN